MERSVASRFSLALKQVGKDKGAGGKDYAGDKVFGKRRIDRIGKHGIGLSCTEIGQEQDDAAEQDHGKLDM